MLSSVKVYVSLLLAIGVAAGEEVAQSKLKRQIYREQVLPARGGKIPDGAFTTDRLVLNKLNKIGIAIPDGVLLEHRHPYRHPHSHDPEDEASLIRIVQKPEDRYVPPEGRYHNQRPATVASTYLIRKPTLITDIRPPEITSHFVTPFPSIETYREEIIPFDGFRQQTFFQDSYNDRPAYVPITVPFRLPNKQAGAIAQLFPRGNDLNVLDWPYLLAEYSRLADEIDRSPYSRHNIYFTPEFISPYGSYDGRSRYARKSKEISPSDQTDQEKRVIKLRCTIGSENAVDGHDTKCRLRY